MKNLILALVAFMVVLSCKKTDSQNSEYQRHIRDSIYTHDSSYIILKTREKGIVTEWIVALGFGLAVEDTGNLSQGRYIWENQKVINFSLTISAFGSRKVLDSSVHVYFTANAEKGAITDGFKRIGPGGDFSFHFPSEASVSNSRFRELGIPKDSCITLRYYFLKE